MHAAQGAPAIEQSSGSKTIADLLPRRAELAPDRPALKSKRGEAWVEQTYGELERETAVLGRGLIALGVAAGDRVAILCQTRPEWTHADLAIVRAGGVVVPIYPTNAPSECEWVLSNSQARVVVCEDASQVAKVAEVRGALPDLEHVVVIDGDVEGAIGLDELRTRAEGVGEAQLVERTAAVQPSDLFTIIYTSGTTGPPKGCMLTHANYRDVLNMCLAAGVLMDQDETTYLFLPLAHAYALLIQLGALDVGARIAYVGGDVKQVVPELMAVRPSYLPSVPRIFEKVYTMVAGSQDPALIAKATEVGGKVRALQAAGQEVPAELQAAFDQFEEALYSKLRGVFGGNVKQCTTGAAPIAHEILEFFWACGIPVMEGFGMTETSTVATLQVPGEHKFGTVGKALPGTEVKIADDGEVLVKGANVFAGYWRNEEATASTLVDGWLHTGDLGTLDEDGFLRIVGRKKDIIITAGGKNLAPANVENDLKQSRWISQAVMHGDRRPYPVVLVTLDPEEIVHFAREHDLPEDPAKLAKEPKVRELVQGVVDQVNTNYAQVEQVKKFVILDHDLSQETGELTPTLKVKRNVVNEKYAELFDELYA